MIPAAGGAAQCWSEGLTSAGAVTWSPDGNRLAAVGSQEPHGMELWQGWLYILDPPNAPLRMTEDSLRPNLSTPALSRPVEMRWTQDGRIIFLGDKQGESFIYEAATADGTAGPLAGGACQTNALSVDQDARSAVVLSTAPSTPGDLFHIDLTSKAVKQLTHYNKDYLAENPPARLEKFNIQRAGLEIECRLWFPPDFDSTQRYPLVLDVHGGPNGAFYDSFVPVQQVLATSGYLVLAVNPRGSSTYGNDFMMAVVGDWGGGPNGPEAIREHQPPGHTWIQLRRVHDQLDRGPDRPVPGGRGGRAMHRPLQHVRHFGHRGKLRRGPVERIAGQRRAIDRTFSHQLRTQRERSGPTASWRSRRPVSHWPKRGILRGAQAARQGGGTRAVPRLHTRLHADWTPQDAGGIPGPDPGLVRPLLGGVAEGLSYPWWPPLAPGRQPTGAAGYRRTPLAYLTRPVRGLLSS